MLRGFRHTLFLLVQSGIVISAAIAWAVQPEAWRAIAICLAGGMVVVWISERLARRWLRATLGRLRRVADDIGHGRPTSTLAVQPGEDLYKLALAVNRLAMRLEEASREEKRLQEQLRRTERLALLGELAASVAHEVNNPLDGIQSCARILRRSGNDPARVQQMLDLIDNGLARIDLIVRRLLTLAREHVIRPVETHISNVLEAAASAVANKIETRGVCVARRYDAADDRVLADPQLLEQVFVNLMLNAADSMAGGGVLTLAVQRQPAGTGGPDMAPVGPMLVIRVIDTGSGIPPDILPHIFEPFYTTKTSGKGTGLGLPIAARIVDAHLGTLTVSPGEAGGTVFTVRLPALGAAAQAAAAERLKLRREPDAETVASGVE